MSQCECKCGEDAATGRRFVSGHNFRSRKPKTPEHRAAIAEGQRKAWTTKRTRRPIGSTSVNAQGYVLVKIVSGGGKWALQHVMVMEEMVGRPVKVGEVVHHINGDRRDNRPANLFLCRDRSHHNDVHRSQDEALRRLLVAGLVTFRDGKYDPVLRGL